jgi:hypothetical protein
MGETHGDRWLRPQWASAILLLYDARMLVFDVALADLHQSRSVGNYVIVAAALALSTLLVAIPVGLGGWLAWRGHAGWSILVAVGSLLLGAGEFAVVAAAFTA